MNSNIEHYEKNLQSRLLELRSGDPAYQLNSDAISNAIIFTSDLIDNFSDLRILDVGCGMGFLTNQLAKGKYQAVGIDPSQKSIEIARVEHSNNKFYVSAGEDFSEIMSQEAIDLFHVAVLNMVLHSIDDQHSIYLLQGLKKCLISRGALIGVVPTQEWLQNKLIENAESLSMSSEKKISWVNEQMQKPVLDLHVKVRASNRYWPEPIVFYNRSEEDYRKLISDAGYSFTNAQGAKSAYYTPLESTKIYELYQRKRILFITFSNL